MYSTDQPTIGNNNQQSTIFHGSNRIKQKEFTITNTSFKPLSSTKLSAANTDTHFPGRLSMANSIDLDQSTDRKHERLSIYDKMNSRYANLGQIRNQNLFNLQSGINENQNNFHGDVIPIQSQIFSNRYGYQETKLQKDQSIKNISKLNNVEPAKIISIPFQPFQQVQQTIVLRQNPGYYTQSAPYQLNRNETQQIPTFGQQDIQQKYALNPLYNSSNYGKFSPSYNSYSSQKTQQNQWIQETLERPKYSKLYNNRSELYRDLASDQEPIMKKTVCYSICWIIFGFLGIAVVVLGILLGLGILSVFGLNQSDAEKLNIGTFAPQANITTSIIPTPTTTVPSVPSTNITVPQSLTANISIPQIPVQNITIPSVITSNITIPAIIPPIIPVPNITVPQFPTITTTNTTIPQITVSPILPGIQVNFIEPQIIPQLSKQVPVINFTEKIAETITANVSENVFIPVQALQQQMTINPQVIQPQQIFISPQSIQQYASIVPSTSYQIVESSKAGQIQQPIDKFIQAQPIGQITDQQMYPGYDYSKEILYMTPRGTLYMIQPQIQPQNYEQELKPQYIQYIPITPQTINSYSTPQYVTSVSTSQNQPIAQPVEQSLSSQPTSTIIQPSPIAQSVKSIWNGFDDYSTAAIAV